MESEYLEHVILLGNAIDETRCCDPVGLIDGGVPPEDEYQLY